jgi:hypothetical protein
MNCRTAEPWLLTSASEALLPRRVRKHLSECARCRRRYRRLLRAESHLAESPSSTAGLGAFLDRIGALPSQPCAAQSKQPSSRVALYWAASILLLIGMIGTQLLSGSDEKKMPDPPPNASHQYKEDQLVSRFVSRDLVLADTAVPAKQWQVLTDMADDLRDEAIRLVEAKSPDDLPMITALYERVLQRGLAGRVDALPAGERKQLLQAMAQHLQKQDAAMDERFGKAPAEWITLLQPMQKATRHTARRSAPIRCPRVDRRRVRPAFPAARITAAFSCRPS